ncbi:hypothetical protein NE237_032057 [Protea cynaroides]|uniref:RING-type domain-containing protein n=1 Tax=Protea cynaroides TaxID=273540 RepID=A0A9Q0R2Q6_9MAGN|nr:hypothetical protein NE237_032057 [Protea cynaroides]
MRIFLQVGLRAGHGGSCERADNLGAVEPKASFYFIIKRKDVVVSSTSIIHETRTSGWSHFVFNIVDFSQLLRPIDNEKCIHDMLTDIPVLSPPTIEAGLKQGLSSYAVGEALLCQERRALYLDIFVVLTFHCVQEIGEPSSSMMMGTVFEGDINGGFTRVPASRSSIQALEIKKFDDEYHTETEDQEQSYSTCMICMDEFVKGVEIARLPCKHFFHGECIFKWLENKNSCPLCRLALPVEELTY